ncbi:MAG TPA: hypothetical protein VLT88_10730 [Desulfosarcina sp.]|nr:hypothetical protein [Desulfosarcina sp.]
MISTEVKGNCTIFKAVGTVSASDILTAAVGYLSGAPTETSLWDFTRTTELRMTALEMQGIAESLKHVSPDRKGGKVALVGSPTINIGLGKMFAAFARMAGLPFRYKAFHHAEQAKAWLADDTV